MRKSFRWSIAGLVLLTAIAALWHLSMQPRVSAGTIFITVNGVERHVRLDELVLTPVAGEIMDGKGEMQQIDASGMELADVLNMAGFESQEFDKVAAIASDGYRAEVTAGELAEPGKVWLLSSGDSAELLVFGDENRKRNVKNVIQLEAE